MGGAIEVMESVYKRNEISAERTNADLTGRGVFAVNVIGAPGAGKTTALLNIIPKLDKHSFVIEGDIQSDIDTKKMNAAGIRTVQINTGGACHLDAPMIDEALRGFAYVEDGFLFIENIGNLVCPAEFLIGEHVKAVLLSCAEGSDKPYKYPLAFEKAGVVIVTKTDLAAAVDFDFEYFSAGVRLLNKTAPIINTSAKTGEGFALVAETLKGFARDKGLWV